MKESFLDLEFPQVEPHEVFYYFMVLHHQAHRENDLVTIYLFVNPLKNVGQVRILLFSISHFTMHFSAPDFFWKSLILSNGYQTSTSVRGQAYDNKKKLYCESWNISCKTPASNFCGSSKLWHNYLDITFDAKAAVKSNQNSIKCIYLSST